MGFSGGFRVCGPFRLGDPHEDVAFFWSGRAPTSGCLRPSIFKGVPERRPSARFGARRGDRLLRSHSSRGLPAGSHILHALWYRVTPEESHVRPETLNLLSPSKSLYSLSDSHVRTRELLHPNFQMVSQKLYDWGFRFRVSGSGFRFCSWA